MFVHPGQYAFLDPDTIRKGLGSFIEDRSMQVLRQPAKYAARLGLSFTATDAVGVKIQYGEFERIPDLGCEEYPHTDGMGTISPEVMEELCKLFYEQRGGVWQGQVVETSVVRLMFQLSFTFTYSPFILTFSLRRPRFVSQVEFTGGLFPIMSNSIK